MAWLERAGYRIRERNWLVREGELDIVAERGEFLCFVEVRMRTSARFGDPSLTVTREKQRRVVRAALRYLQRRPGPAADDPLRRDDRPRAGPGRRHRAPARRVRRRDVRASPAGTSWPALSTSSRRPSGTWGT